MRGAEAADFLQGQVSNDVEALAPGSGCYATVLTVKGKLRTDLRILRGEDFFWLDTEAIGHAVLRHMLTTYTLGRDVQWEDLTEDHALLSLMGPAVDGLVDEPPPAAEHSFVDTGRGLLVRTALGVDLLCSNAAAEEWRERLGVEPVSEEAVECLRIESGRPAARVRHGRRDDASGGGHQRARRELHQGLLRGPGDGRAAALPGQAQPASARPSPVRARTARKRDPAGRTGRRPAGLGLQSPRASAR